MFYDANFWIGIAAGIVIGFAIGYKLAEKVLLFVMDQQMDKMSKDGEARIDELRERIKKAREGRQS